MFFEKFMKTVCHLRTDISAQPAWALKNPWDAINKLKQITWS